MQYFITDHDGNDFLGNHWSPNTTHNTDNPNHHFLTYQSPHLALLLNAADNNYTNPRLWIAKGNPKPHDFRSQQQQLTVINEICLPKFERLNYISFGIICTLDYMTDKVFVRWGLNYLSGRDRSEKAAGIAAVKLHNHIMAKNMLGTHAAVEAALGDEFELYSGCAARMAAGFGVKVDDLAPVVAAYTPEQIADMLAQ